MMNRRQLLARSLRWGAQLIGVPLCARHEFVPYVLGANTAVSGYGLYQAIALLREIGFGTIEMQNLVGTPEPVPGEFPGFRLDRIDGREKRRIKDALAAFEHVTTHLPYSGLEYFAPAGYQAEQAIRTLEMTLQATAFLGAKVAVLHPKPGPGMRLEETWPIMVRRIRRWGDAAAHRGFRLALETGYPASVKDFVRLVQEIDHDHVGAALDVGHQSRYAELTARVRPDQRGTPEGIRAYNDINIELVSRLGAKLIHLHVHDIEPATWKEHQPLVYGFVDYPRLLGKLREINYQGVLVLEIGGEARRMPQYLADAKQKLERHLAAA